MMPVLVALLCGLVAGYAICWYTQVTRRRQPWRPDVDDWPDA